MMPARHIYPVYFWVTFDDHEAITTLRVGGCDFKIFSISVLSFIGSVCAPDTATFMAENHALQCTTAGPYNAIPLHYFR